ncbi:hypothetical protein EZZ79_24355 [Pseudomonas syringae]|nr:hypothetical protein EZZ79_24355 [Pseudomonas syringae]
MSAKGPLSFPTMHRLKDRLREQVRSYPSGRRLFLILPNGRRSGLVREGAVKVSKNVSPERASSRTSSLRAPARIKSGLVYDDGRGAWAR